MWQTKLDPIWFSCHCSLSLFVCKRAKCFEKPASTGIGQPNLSLAAQSAAVLWHVQSQLQLACLFFLAISAKKKGPCVFADIVGYSVFLWIPPVSLSILK